MGKEEVRCGMVVVDECSMIDVGMWELFSAQFREGTRLILVGDHDQLLLLRQGRSMENLWLDEGCHPECYAHLDECMRSDQVEILEKAAIL
ncbi:MAG: AAA family ATPase [Chlamydiales bacterium]|nr:AAA family ATPase [Chlamydiales bacterium]